jgi:hypothetical protein
LGIKKPTNLAKPLPNTAEALNFHIHFLIQLKKKICSNRIESSSTFKPQTTICTVTRGLPVTAMNDDDK